MQNQMRLPFFYGWIIVVVTFVTMAIGVNARTAFSLFFPPIIGEFGWERGITAGAFSFGFVVSGAISPLIGRMMDRYGPRAVMEIGVALMGGGLLLAPLTTQPWHLYLTIGVLVGAGSVCLGYSGQSLFLPNWFIRRRGLAMGLAFAGVGIGSVTLLPWVQHMIEQTGWRTACTAMGILVLVALAPIKVAISGSLVLQGLYKLDVTGGDLSYDNPLNHQEEDAGSQLLVVHFSRTALVDTCCISAGQFSLKLPDGTAAAADRVEECCGIGTAGTTKPDQFVTFVFKKADGNYDLIAKEKVQDTQEQADAPFTINNSAAGGSSGSGGASPSPSGH